MVFNFENMKKLIALTLFSFVGFSQNNPNPGYWQQHVDYKMKVDMNVKDFKYIGIIEM